MKKQKSRGKRAAAAVLGILLVLTLLTSISAVTGNPLIAAIGACRAARYAAGTYGITDAAVSSGKKESVCSFTYWYTVASEHSPDTAFIVQVPLWGGIRDNYEYAVTQLHNTRERLGRERAASAQAALNGTPYADLMQECSVEYGYLPPSVPETFPEIPFKDAFTLDMPFDAKAVAVPTLLKITLVGDNASEDELKRILPEIKAAMEQSGLYFDYYTVYYEKSDASYDTSGFSGIYSAEAVPKDAIV